MMNLRAISRNQFMSRKTWEKKKKTKSYKTPLTKACMSEELFCETALHKVAESISMNGLGVLELRQAYI